MGKNEKILDMKKDALKKLANPIKSSKFTDLDDIFTQEDVEVVSSNPYALIRSWCKRGAIKVLGNGKYQKLVGLKEKSVESSDETTDQANEGEVFSPIQPIEIKVVGKIDLDRPSSTDSKYFKNPKDREESKPTVLTEELKEELKNAFNNHIDLFYMNPQKVHETAVYIMEEKYSEVGDLAADYLKFLLRLDFMTNDNRLGIPEVKISYDEETREIRLINSEKHLKRIQERITAKIDYLNKTNFDNPKALEMLIRSLRIFIEKKNYKDIEIYSDKDDSLMSIYRLLAEYTQDLSTQFSLRYEDYVQTCSVCGKSFSLVTFEQAKKFLEEIRHSICKQAIEERANPEDVILPHRIYYSKECGCYHITHKLKVDNAESRIKALTSDRRLVKAIIASGTILNTSDLRGYRKEFLSYLDKQLKELRSHGRSKNTKDLSLDTIETETTTANSVSEKGYRTKTTIICPVHGKFEQTPDSHLNSSEESVIQNQETIRVVEETMEPKKVELNETGIDELYQNLSVMIIRGEFTEARTIISESKEIILKKKKPTTEDFVNLGQLGYLENRLNILENSL